MTSFDIDMTPAETRITKAYGITYKSTFVYRWGKNGSWTPVRVVVWDNTRRLNPRNGEPVRNGEYGPIDGGNGKYLSPENKATDDAFTVLLTPEATVISAHGDNTGTVASGQVYARDVFLRDGDTVTLVLGGFLRTDFQVVRGGNEHGYLIK